VPHDELDDGGLPVLAQLEPGLGSGDAQPEADGAGGEVSGGWRVDLQRHRLRHPLLEMVAEPLEYGEALLV